MAVVVDIWEEEQVKGVRLDTKEQVTVRLSKDYTPNSNSSNERPSIKTMATEFYCKEGAVIHFESCNFNEKEGCWYSRWPNIVTKKANDKKRAATIVYTRPYVGSKENGNYILLKMFAVSDESANRSVPINTLDDLQSLITKYMVPRDQGVHPIIVLIGSDGENKVTMNVDIPRHKDSTGASYPETDSSKTYAMFLETDDGKAAVELINDPSVTLYALRGKSVFVGKKTVQKMLKTEQKAKFLKDEYKIDRDGEYVLENLGYKPTVVAVMTHEETEMKFASYCRSLATYGSVTPETELM
ncbi:TPA: hypothetical protein I7730_14045 [Vibrio vulnificus]|uniref:Uncharacterized protein n=1 Tax=Vibrio vulnificus TaxID=672 RepID=A0A8H9TFE8_VIBVL|nr:hypothetical protein [Vibrio vulnificus]